MRKHPWDLSDPPKIVVTLHTEDFRGDHAADAIVAVDVAPGETVEALARRLLTDKRRHDRDDDWLALSDHIEIRVTLPAPSSTESENDGS